MGSISLIAHALLVFVVCFLSLADAREISRQDVQQAADDTHENNILRESRGFDGKGAAPRFGYPDNDMIDWNAFFAGQAMSKRALGQYNDILESSYGLNDHGFEDWAKSFSRTLRSFHNGYPGHLGNDGKLAGDGFQNWRAFFQSPNKRAYQKRDM